MIGIYYIKNIVTGHVYVGQSIDVARRMCHHRYKMNAGIHSNRRLQEDWRMFGPDAFTFNVETECAIDDLVWCEQEAVDKVRPELRYNVGACSQSPRLGAKTSDETKAKQRKAATGRRMRPESCARMSASHAGVPLSSEHAANAGAARRGYRHRQESKNKISAARKAFWSNKRAA